MVEGNAPDMKMRAGPSSSRSLDVGDPAPVINAADEGGQIVCSRDDYITGRPILLAFCGTPGKPAALQELAALSVAAEEIAARGAAIFAVTSQAAAANAAWREAHGIRFPVLADQGNIFATYGLQRGSPDSAFVAFLLDPAHRVMRIAKGAGAAARMLEELRAIERPEPTVRLRTHPPVLVLPRVLGAADCDYLIQAFHRSVRVWDSDGRTNAGFANEAGDFVVRHHGQYGKLREFVVRDPEVQRLLDSRLQRRVLPEMKKAFQTVPTGREGYRISCYDAAEGGSLRPHRDDSVPQIAHRRFTVTVNLNAGEYEGGELRFPEYGDQLYDVERGTAVAWSATLLHEVLPMRSGRRFVTGVHLFGFERPDGAGPSTRDPPPR